MTWTLVQTASYATPNTATAAPAATFTNPVGSGNLVVGWMAHFAALSATAFTDDKSDTISTTWGVLDDTADAVLTAAFILLNVTSGAKTFTGHCATSDFCMLNIAEFSNTGGAATATDGTTGQFLNNTNTGTSGNITTTVDGDLIVGVGMNGGAATVPSIGAGFTTAGTSTGSTAVFSQAIEYQTQATHGAIAATFTYTGSPGSCTAVIAVKAPTGGAATPFNRNEAGGNVLFFGDDSSVWSGGPTAPNLNLLVPSNPVGPYEYRYWTSEDETPTWQWEEPYNLAIFGSMNPPEPERVWSSPDDGGAWQPQIKLNIQLYQVQVTTPRVVSPPQFDLDDPAVWYRDQSSFNTVAQASFLAKPRARATQQWTSEDETPTWQKIIYRNNSLLVPHTPQVQRTRQFNYDDNAVWYRDQSNFNTIAQAGFLKKPQVQSTRHLDYNDASIWSGEPTSPTIGLLGTLAPPSPFGVKYTRQFNYDDVNAWQWKAPYNLTVYGSMNPPEPDRYWSSPDDGGVWSGSPGAPNIGLTGQLAPQTPFGVTYTRQFHYDDVNAWQWKAPYNLPAYGTMIPPTIVHFWFSPDDPPVWSGEPNRNNVITFPTAPPPVQLMRQLNYDDIAVWYRDQSNFNALAQAGFLKKPEVQGTHHFDYNDASSWDGSPTSPSIGLLGTFTPQSPFAVKYTRQFNYDDASSWQWKAPYNLGISGPAPQTPPTIDQFWSSPDDSSLWSWHPVYNLVIVPSPPQQTPPTVDQFWSSPDDSSLWLWKPNYNVVIASSPPPSQTPPTLDQFWSSPDDSAVWLRNQSQFNAPISALSLAKPKVRGTIHLDYDDHSSWQHVIYRNVSLLKPQFPPVQGTRQFNYDDPGSWQWTIYRRNALLFNFVPPVQLMRQFFQDDAAEWKHDVPHLNLPVSALFLPKPQVQQMRQFNYDDASVWQHYIYRNYVVHFLPPPAPPAQVLSGRTVIGVRRMRTVIGGRAARTMLRG